MILNIIAWAILIIIGFVIFSVLVYVIIEGIKNHKGEMIGVGIGLILLSALVWAIQRLFL